MGWSQGFRIGNGARFIGTWRKVCTRKDGVKGSKWTVVLGSDGALKSAPYGSEAVAEVLLSVQTDDVWLSRVQRMIATQNHDPV
jgi:hypothetical protein